MIRAVIDTNVLLSAFASPAGTASQAVLMALRQGNALVSTETFAEFAAKLSISRFAAKYGSETERMAYLAQFRRIVEFVDVTSQATAPPDPKDNMFLALAVDGRADCIISGDKKHMLVLGNYRGIPIFSPAEFINRYRAR